jgi:mannose-6-phosphate isomerase-like protein (cupin superfamily)
MRSMDQLVPSQVLAESARMRSDTADDGFRVGVLIDADSHGSPLLLGLAWVRPGTASVSWTADAQTHETYYIERGRLRVTWDGPNGGEATLAPTDSFYFPPGRTYTAENVGEEEVMLIWSLVPSPSSSWAVVGG